MVKVKPFCGAVFSPQDYDIFLKDNVQHIEPVPTLEEFNTTSWLANRKPLPEQYSSFYIYRQIYMEHTSLGILGEISIHDYHVNKIRKHENTLCRPHLNSQTYKKGNIQPVVVGYRKDDELRAFILRFVNKAQIFSAWTTQDGKHHTLWKVGKQQSVIFDSFNSIESLCILDGHHRMEAAHQNYLIRDKTSEDDQWIPALLFSSQYIRVYSQHRVLQKTSESFNFRKHLEKLQTIEITDLERFENREGEIHHLLCEYQIVMKEFGQYFGINFKDKARNTLQKVPSYRLHAEIFDVILDKESLKEIKQVPDIAKEDIICQNKVVFFVRPPEIETVFEVGDQNLMMPAKSTWIEPKPYSHMTIRFVDRIFQRY